MQTEHAHSLNLPGHLEIVLGENGDAPGDEFEHVIQLRDRIAARGSKFFGNVYLLSFTERFTQQQVGALAQQLGLPDEALSMTNPVGRNGELDASVLADLAAWMHQALVFGERIAIAVPAGGNEVIELLLAGIRIRNGSAETEDIEARFGEAVQSGSFSPETFELLVGMYMTGKLHHRNENELAMLDGRPNAVRIAALLDGQLNGAPILTEQRGPDQTALTFALKGDGDPLACTVQLMEDPTVIRVQTFAPARMAAPGGAYEQVVETIARLNLTLSPEVIHFDPQNGTVSGSSAAILPADEQSAEGLIRRLIEGSSEVVRELIPVLDALLAEDTDRYEAAVNERARKVAARGWMI